MRNLPHNRQQLHQPPNLWQKKSIAETVSNLLKT